MAAGSHQRGATAGRSRAYSNTHQPFTLSRVSIRIISARLAFQRWRNNSDLVMKLKMRIPREKGTEG
ncbi:unnamed protein product [Pleuronectes platessa]|uniref:Uncharacterized protein n=1 Tax=Pleuronectes platessa TaxID=8262 RepID=A0A9N7YS88_PLEPL|nr:unnamed protein product [Pleuronectes platessa]